MSDFAEIWKPVVGYEGLYDVSSIGRVRSLVFRNRFTNRPRAVPLVLRQSCVSSGYQCVTLCRHDVKKTQSVCALVAEAFLGPRPGPHHQVAHGDGSRTNNRVENLRWATPTENAADRKRHGRGPAGEGNARAILTQAQVAEIRRRYAAGGVTQTQLGTEYGVDQTTVSDITRGASWREGSSHV